MTDKAKGNRIQRVPPPEERDLQKSDLPPDEAAYRERSARERTSALPPDYRDLRERGSVLPPDYHDPEKSALPPDKANHPETVVLPEGEAPAQQKAERYYAEHVQLGPKAGGSALAALQEALNKGARHSRKLVSVVHDPTSQANVILVWDTEAFISG